MSDFLLASHFTDKANLQVFKNVDQFNVRHFDDEIVILDCRKVYTWTVLKGPGDEIVNSTMSIYTFHKVDALDRIDGKDVLAITEWKSLLTNQVIGYIVRV